MRHQLDEDLIFDALEATGNYLSLSAVYLQTDLVTLYRTLDDMGITRHVNRAIERRQKSAPPPEGSNARHEYLCKAVTRAYDMCGRNKTRFSEFLGVSLRTSRQWFRCGHTFRPPPRFGVGKGTLLWALEKELIEDIIARCKGNLSKASRVLGISVRALRMKVREYGRVVRPDR